MKNNPITLGQFRKLTENLSNDVELYFDSQATGQIPIGTMDADGNIKLVFAMKHYGESNIEGMLRAAAFLKKKV